ARRPVSPPCPYTTLFRSVIIIGNVVGAATLPATRRQRTERGSTPTPGAVVFGGVHPAATTASAPNPDPQLIVQRNHKSPTLRERSEEHTSELQSRENIVC